MAGIKVTYEARNFADAARIMHEASRADGSTATWWTAEAWWAHGAKASSGEPCGRGVVARWLEARYREHGHPARITLTPHTVEID